MERCGEAEWPKEVVGWAAPHAHMVDKNQEGYLCHE